MSEMPSRASTIDTPSPGSTDKYPQVEFGDEAVLSPDWQLDIAYSETNTPPENLPAIPESTVNTQNNVPPTHEETEAHVKLTSIGAKRLEIMEQHVLPRTRKVRENLDKVKTVGDKAEQKILLLNQREAARQRKTARLEAKLAATPKGTIRYRRLERKLAKKHIGLNNMRDTQAWLNGRIGGREGQRSDIEKAKQEVIRAKQEMLIVAKKVALEKKRRRTIESEVKSTKNEIRKEELKFEIKSWDTIGQFRRKLMDELTKEMRERIKNK